MDNIDQLLIRFVARSKAILRDQLVGIYLHGSAVMGCFNPAKSDVDLIIVVDGPLSDTIKKQYMDMVISVNADGPAKGIEMSVVTADVCRPFVYPTPFELHFSTMHLEWYQKDPDAYIQKMKGTDKDLAAHFTILMKRGRCLYGAPIQDVFSAVPEADYLDSIWNDIAEAEASITEDPMYLTLNLARVLAFKEQKLVLSKKEGGEWALEHVPAVYTSLLQSALQEYTEGTAVTYDRSLAQQYAGYMIRRIQIPTGGGNLYP